ncbi:SMC-Scp complex subunit ScpB [Sulfuriferula nivalis]|uniref:Segregation and condensation protein B n=1 Tax=Sulfuriferula nivalis TaxID=2675298 RepID=A0A809SGN7_9PROT|nr:SMC-Scp complex subunit ScpB [Sulfuriferula nivalis]BBP00090.1 hypothetical protein SFSGTM_07980 [Sulfuriferula nivalis]
MKINELKNILEVMLFAHGEPLTISEMRTALTEDLSAELIYRALNELRADWENKGLALVVVADGWRFQTRAEYQTYLQRLSPERPPKYSRAVMETLAVIAYKQPVTRGDIEEIRGVTVNTQIIKTLEQREWIKTVGHREVPGRPALYVTTPQFLSDLNLRALAELPPLAELGQLVAPNPYTLDLELSSDAAE